MICSTFISSLISSGCFRVTGFAPALDGASYIKSSPSLMWTMSPSSRTMTWSVCSMMAAGSLERKYCRLWTSSVSFRSSNAHLDARIATWAAVDCIFLPELFLRGESVNGLGTWFCRQAIWDRLPSCLMPRISGDPFLQAISSPG